MSLGVHWPRALAVSPEETLLREIFRYLDISTEKANNATLRTMVERYGSRNERDAEIARLQSQLVVIGENLFACRVKLGERDDEIARLRDELECVGKELAFTRTANAELLAFVRKIAADGTMWPSERDEAKVLVAKYGG